MTWTRFMDMHSGGGRKTEFDYVYIEGGREDAIAVFVDTFGQNPEDTECECCGDNFSISESETLEGSTEYERKHEPDARTRIIRKLGGAE